MHYLFLYRSSLNSPRLVTIEIVAHFVFWISYRMVFLAVVLPDIGDNLTYKDGLHFCEEVYPNRNRKKVQSNSWKGMDWRECIYYLFKIWCIQKDLLLT